MGDSLAAILDECEAQEIPWPKEIADHVDRQEPWMAFYFEAFADLSTCRGMSGQIPWLAIDRYAERLHMESDFALWFIRAIRAIDDSYVDVWREQQAREQAQAEARAKSGRH